MSGKIFLSKKTLRYLIEVNVGQDRCGLEPGADVSNFLKNIESQFSDKLEFLGLLCYQGWNQHVRSIADRKSAVIDKVGDKVRQTIQAIESDPANLPKIQIITGGGTGTFLFEAESGLYNEVQPGSYIFMDKDYNLNQQDCNFKQALFLLSSITSINQTQNFLVLDAGWKSTTMDSGVPAIKGNLGIRILPKKAKNRLGKGQEQMQKWQLIYPL